MRKIAVTNRGERIGEGHPKAILTDKEVGQLLSDRGDDESPKMSYNQLARKYGVSKGCVRDIIKGRRRGQIGQTVDRPLGKRAAIERVRVNLSISLYARAKLMRKGGGKWLEKMLDTVK